MDDFLLKLKKANIFNTFLLYILEKPNNKNILSYSYDGNLGQSFYYQSDIHPYLPSGEFRKGPFNNKNNTTISGILFRPIMVQNSYRYPI